MTYLVKNISRNIKAVFFKLGTRNVHHKRNRMIPTTLLPTFLAPVSFCEKPNIPICNLLIGTEGLSRNTHGSHIVVTLSIRHCFNIFKLFKIECCIVCRTTYMYEVNTFLICMVQKFNYLWNEKDIPKRKIPFLFTLESLSNEHFKGFHRATMMIITWSIK